MAFDENAYKNQYDSEHYFKIAVRVKKEHRALVTEAAKKAGLSVNEAFLRAFRSVYGVDLLK